MLLTVWMYAYLRGVLSTRAVEDRCRYDATFRVACGRPVPDHTTFSRFRRHLFGRGPGGGPVLPGPARLRVRGTGPATVVAGDGVKIAANASKEASRTEAGLRKLAAQVIAGARKAAADEDADRGVLPGTDLLLGADTVPAAGSAVAGRAGAGLPGRPGSRAGGRRKPRPGSRGGPTWRRWRTAPRGRPAPGRGGAGRAAAAAGEGHRRRGGHTRGLAGAPRRRAAGTRPPAGPAPARRPARPAPAWKHCRPGPPPKPGRQQMPGTRRKAAKRRSATSPTRTPG